MQHRAFNKVLPIMLTFIVAFVAHTFFGGVHAQDLDAACAGIGQGNTPAGITGIICVLARVINVLLWASVSIFSVMVAITAYKYATSIGDPKGIAGANLTLTYATLGLLGVIGVFTIITLILNTLGLKTGFGGPTQFVQAILDNVCGLFSDAFSSPIVTGIPGCN